MADDVLFIFTKEHLETGLRGVPVGYCVTSSVDPIKGLFYVGKPIQELASWEPERVMFLLYHGREGSPSELAAFSQTLKASSRCNPETLKRIRQLPRTGHPMKLFCAAILIAGMIEGIKGYREDALSLIAKIPEITATVINHHGGFGENNPSDTSLGYVENFVQMLRVEKSAHFLDIMKLFNILHYDHGGGNLSCFTGKIVASGLEDMYGSLCAAMAALAGPRHGRANQDCLEFIHVMEKELGDTADAIQVEKFVRNRLENNQLVFGFGHAVLRVEDPRATLFYQVAEKWYPKNPLVHLALLLRTQGTKVLLENPKISNPYPNVDAISGVLLSAAGFPYPEYFTLLFGMARVVGIAIQIVYERCEAREGKGTPIVRPKFLYKTR